MKKIKTPVLLLAIIGLFSSFSAMASGELKYEKVSSAEELKEIINTVKNDLFFPELKEETGYLFEDAYKRYNMEEHSFAYSYLKGVPFDKLVSDFYVWVVPTETGKQIIISNTEEKWQIIGYSHSEKNEENSDLINKDSVIKSIELISEKIEDVQFIYTGAYFSSFAFIKTDKEEYLIPFSVRPDFTKLENGKLYTAKEASAILLASFGEPKIDDTSNGGANGGANTDNNDILLISLIVGTCVIVGVIAYTILRKKRMENT